MRVLIVGCGYVGIPLGALLGKRGHAVYGLRRSPSAEAALTGAGIRLVVGDVTDPASLSGLPGPFDWVVHCVSAGRGGLDAYQRAYVEGTQHLLAHLANQAPVKLVYTSSTSVYGQNDGAWVTEESATIPMAPTGRILLEAERLVLGAAGPGHVPGVVLRLAGIYGPGRDYWRRQFIERNGQMDGDGERVLNMIHRDDVAGAITAALERGTPGEVYNVVDDEPVTQRDLFSWLAMKMGTGAPTMGPLETAARKRGATNKRVCNRKLRESLRFNGRFPTFRQGFETL